MEDTKEEIIKLKANLKMQEKKVEALVSLLEEEGIISRREFEEKIE